MGHGAQNVDENCTSVARSPSGSPNSSTSASVVAGACCSRPREDPRGRPRDDPREERKRPSYWCLSTLSTTPTIRATPSATSPSSTVTSVRRHPRPARRSVRQMVRGRFQPRRTTVLRARPCESGLATVACSRMTGPVALNMTMDGLPVRGSVVIPESELRWRFSRSSGPGGQSVNTTDSGRAQPRRGEHDRAWPDPSRAGPGTAGGPPDRRRPHRDRVRAPFAMAQPRGRAGQAGRHVA